MTDLKRVTINSNEIGETCDSKDSTEANDGEM